MEGSMTLLKKELDFSVMPFTPESEWGKCALAWLDQTYRKSGSIHSYVHYRAVLQEFFASMQPCKMPQFVTKADVTAYILSPARALGRVGRPVATGTINNRASILRSFYRYASTYAITGDDGHLYPLFPYLSPTATIPYGKNTTRRDKAMSDDELELFFAEINKGHDPVRVARDRAICLLFLWSARRRSEVLALQWKDLEQTLIMDNGKMRPAWVYKFRSKGTKMQEDCFECPPVAVKAILDFLTVLGIRDTMEPDDYLFTALPPCRGILGYDRKRPLSLDALVHMMKRYARAAGIRDISPHTWRHTSARCAYAAGATVREISQKLRHKDLKTTTIYLETLCELSDPTIDRLTAKFANL
jgi:integrase